MSIDVNPILALSRAEKLMLMQLILDSLQAQEEEFPLSSEQIAEIRETSRLYRAGKIKGSSWGQTKARILHSD
jgi:putative addiction module component (TIGR02574 family)